MATPSDTVNPARVGCAGWSVHAFASALFPPTGSHLERYAGLLNAVEINSSFHREHRIATYARWAASVPDGFRFSAKIPKSITHEQRLVGAEPLIERFVAGPAALGPHAGPLVVQLPPSLALDPAIADGFFAAVRRHWEGPLVCEPRHPSWFGPDGEEILRRHRTGRVAADPVLAPGADRPGGWPGVAYWRLHGSPRTYFSGYSPERLEALAAALDDHAAAAHRWCIFDNTALGAAAHDAVALGRLRGAG